MKSSASATWVSLRRRLPRKQEVAGAFRSRSCETARGTLAHPCKRGSRGLTPFVLAIGDLLALVVALALALLVLVKSLLLLGVGVDEESGALACRWSHRIQYVRQTIIKEGKLISPSIKRSLGTVYLGLLSKKHFPEAADSACSQQVEAACAATKAVWHRRA